MSDTTSLMFLMAKHLPREALISKLKESISDYEHNPTEENYSSLCPICMLIIQKDAIETLGMDKLNKMLNERDQMEALTKHFNQKQ